MSANRATNQRLGFHRWLASLKREAPSAPGVTDPPLSARPPAVSTAPAAHGASTAPTPHAKGDDDATRVHHIPKEIIYRMRARAASQAPEAPEALQDERTQVFRAPPELLARAQRAEAASEPPDDGVLEEHDFGETLEARSGVSLRRQEPPPSIQPPEMRREVEEPLESQAPLESEEPLDDATVTLPAHASVPSHVVGPDLVNEALSEASIERLSEAPSFRNPLGAKLWVAALMAAVALLLAWSAR